MHPEIQQHKPGRCPHCGMRLVLQEKLEHPSMHHEPQEVSSYQPLFIIIGLITLVTAAVALQSWSQGAFSLQATMMNFMAGFFLVFSGFKLLDLKGFAQGYSTYDLLAQKVFHYGYIYPFLELGLGLLYVTHNTSPALSLFTFALMSLSGLGVLNKLRKDEPFQCACLGTFLKVPLTKVTFIEDFGMALMALGMLISQMLR